MPNTNLTVQQYIDRGNELEDLRIFGVVIEYTAPENYSVTTSWMSVENLDYSQVVTLLKDMDIMDQPAG